jgi:type II secretion system protein C
MAGLREIISKIRDQLGELRSLDRSQLGKKLEGIFSTKKVSLETVKTWGVKIVFALFIGFICASALSSLSVLAIFNFLNPSQRNKAATPVQELSLQALPNYHLIKKGIIARNVFNAGGEYPPEQDKNKDKADASKKFDLTAACNTTALKITLPGIIKMGEKSSVAVIKEAGVEEADIYRIGDFIIGSETAQVAGIMQDHVILNNNGRKECIFLQGTEVKPSMLAGTGGEEDSPPVTLQASWVESELGEGFSKILQSARLVPNTEGNKVKGFKIFAIQAGTLFEKVGLKDGDVVVQVNDTVMEAEQGFALYQAFLDEKSVNIHVLRDGKTPSTLKVRIR